MGILMFGEVVWDDITPRGGSGKPEHLGGAPLNVAANCVKLGIQSGVCSALGRDTWGDAALQGVEMLEVDSRLIVRNERDTCLIQVRFDKQGEPYYIIPENVSWDFIKVPFPKWELVKKYSSLYYGTLALRSRESRETLQQILQQGRFAHVLCDVNLRPPFYSAETVEFCLQHCDRAKLNEEELDKVCALFSLEGQSLKDKMRAVMVRFSLEALIVTLGKNGAAYLDQAGFGISPGIPTSVKDPVGAGDGFCAGLLVSLERGCSLEEACGLGNQLGAYIASKTSSIPFYTQEEFLSWRSCHV